MPILTALAPSARYYRQRGRSPKTLLERAVQTIAQLRRWLPQRDLVVAADSSYAALDFLQACQALPNPVTLITRLRMDAALYEPAPPYAGFGAPTQERGASAHPPAIPARPRHRLDDDLGITLANRLSLSAGCSSAIPWANWIPVPCSALPKRLLPNTLCPGLCRVGVSKSPSKKLALTLASKPSASGRTWRLRVLPQRCLACFPGSPLSLISFNLISLSRAWYAKSLPTFSDAIALARQALWPCSQTFSMSPAQPDMVEIPRPLLDSFLNTLHYTA
jgi:hypothetical protein